MEFYIVLFIFLVFMHFLNENLIQKDKWVVELLTLIILILISGTRLNMGGSDYSVYKSVYDSIPPLKEFILNFNTLHDNYLTYGFEIGFLFMNSFLKSINLNFYGFTLVHSIFFYSALYIGLKKYVYNFNFLLIIFIYKLFFYNTFISMRQSITLALFLLALTFLEKRKIIPYMIMCLIAISFHTAAFILIPIYFITYIKLDKKLLIIFNLIFLPSIFISIFNIPIFSILSFVTNYVSNPALVYKLNNFLFSKSQSFLSLFHTIECLLIMLYLFSNFNDIKKYNPNSDNIIKLFLCLIPLFTLFRNYEILTRFKDYFVFTYGVVLGYRYTLSSSYRYQIMKIVVILICAFGFFRYIMLFDNGSLMPYTSYLFTGISIFGN